MNNFFRAIIAGYGAKKLGGGCLGTVLVFILIWVALGQCSFRARYDDREKVNSIEAKPGLFRENNVALSEDSRQLFSQAITVSTTFREQ